jgi:hypothetical protein
MSAIGPDAKRRGARLELAYPRFSIALIDQQGPQTLAGRGDAAWDGDYLTDTHDSRGPAVVVCLRRRPVRRFAAACARFSAPARLRGR